MTTARSVLALMLVCVVVAGGTGNGQSVLPRAFFQPDSGYTSNAATDVIAHDGGVWFATDEGLMATFDGGETWQRFGTNAGLKSEIVSAVYSSGPRLWAGISHSDIFDGRRYTVSDAVSYSDDGGRSWTNIDFSSSGQNIKWVEGTFRTVFDITGHRDDVLDADWVFFAAFAGGLLASRDGGLNWRRIFPSVLDSIQLYGGSTPSERNRGFACAVDTSHGDSLYLWTGTADGIFQYVFAPKREKAYTRYVTSLAFCNSCQDTSWLFVGGREAVTRGRLEGRPFISRFEEDGLPGPAVSAMLEVGGRLLVGTYAPLTSELSGLAWSDDYGESFQSNDDPVTSFNGQHAGSDGLIGDFALMRSRVYMAAQTNGLFVSSDTGENWTRILLDSTETDGLKNTANALFAWGDTLLVGTDTGLATVWMDSLGLIDSLSFKHFGEYDSTATEVSSTRIVQVRPQFFTDSATGMVDSTIYWTINRPLTEEGRRMVGRRNAEGEWDQLQWRAKINDLNFIGDTAIVCGESGNWYTRIGSNPNTAWPIERLVDSIPVDSLGNDVVTRFKVRGDTLVFGSNNGFAVSTDRGHSYQIHRVNKDTLRADLVIHHTASQILFQGLIGDFIPAIDVQYRDDGPAHVWVGNRNKTYFPDTNAISVGRSVPVDSTGEEVDPDSPDFTGYAWKWERVFNETFAWNFTFNGDSTFAATDSGLVLFEYDGESWPWEYVELDNESEEPWLLPGTPVYGAEARQPYLWLATADRTLQLQLSDLDNQTAHMVVDSATPPDEVYAFPVPFSHSIDGAAGGAIDFHFVVKQPANVTIEIYDYAMNLVARVIDGRSFPKGIYPTTGSHRPTWDGLNGRGEKVAVGVYYFKVELSTGETRWGKLAIIP
jgi:hypothetical protein